ncbi:MAG: fluoride efflux transporter CrcB [Alicyclobacillaceae bacterium]|nr:fluoride efflux transporter CrcB [Alicyclobacillaceae bacterium]
MNVVATAMGGLAGGCLRWLLEAWIPTSHGFPVCTLVINLAGSLALGFFGSAADRADVRPCVRAGVGTGFIGAFTTFSTFCWDTYRLLHAQAFVYAALYVVGSVMGGLLSALTGSRLALALTGPVRRAGESVS